MADDRVLDLEGVHNFRDYGGYPVAGGGRLKRKVLWRSGQHHGATEADLERIGQLGLALVFDLRSSTERTSHPCRRPAAFAAEVHYADDPPRKPDRELSAAPHVAAAQMMRERTPQSTREGMLRNYAGIAFRPELLAMQRRFFQELAAGKGASLVNCMAGKDRTGITVALLHEALGVHRDDIIEDYVLTNTAGDPEARIRAGMETIGVSHGGMEEAVLRVLLGVEPEYLESAFAKIEEQHGSTEAYLRDLLGVDQAVRNRLREALVD